MTQCYEKEKALDEPAAEATALPGIALPVFKSLKIADYELFPGVGNAGIDRPILPGVTVIAGINGLGKTTLLNVMLRLLVGPFNPQKVNPFEVGAKSHEWSDGSMPVASSERA